MSSVGNDDNGCIPDLYNVSSKICTVTTYMNVQLLFFDIVIRLCGYIVFDFQLQ